MYYYKLYKNEQVKNMQGFGMLNNLDALKDIVAKMQGIPLVPSDNEVMEETNKDELNNVNVPLLHDGNCPYKASDTTMGASGNKSQQVIDDAGNKVIDTAPVDPSLMELAGMGIGKTFKKAMTRTEAFEGSVDESPMDDASEVRQKNVIEKVEDLFNDMYGKSYEKKSKEKDPKFDYDFTKPHVVLDNTSMFKVKKGW